ncbi:zonular occludens toxin domain-containing protein [Neisseria sp. Dent CA1/247]|uniref:zonular occludens toxin domain-containing protein n=1 Tax=Neisseria sp. Dent CA1/247 TaxID=2912675 RepID=UPI001FD1EE7B|nr:zonular occludens toxin domain-containing protein [Neisseria sp. Dent CA1/247]UOO78106.1 zonular occludens toxin domain-containing protein [Neisseria sp. Dent CA1/247]
MIYLITGNMGTGKTSKVVSMMLKNEDGLFKMKLDDGTQVFRPIYFCHVDGLDKKKFKAKELTEEQIQSAPLNQLIPTGSVLIVDECDYCYPTRSSGREVPPYIKTLKELRHEGFTLILMTQHPMMIDPYLRNLVSKHIHLERKPIGMKQYWWYKAVTNLENPASVTGVQSSSWRPPKEAFKYYKSSSKHVDFSKNIPLAFYALFFVLAVVLWKGYSVYNIYKKGVSGQPDYVESEFSSVQTDKKNVISSLSEEQKKNSLNELMFEPTIKGKTESKPLYDAVRQVRSFEYPVACISGGSSGCTCYTNQGTAIKEIEKKTCETYVKDGLPFNPYKDERQNSQNRPYESVERGSPSPAPEVLVMGGKSQQNLMYDGYVEAGEQFR